jgi:hypothetical protein
MRTTLGSTSLRRGYVPTRLARADARSAACVCSAAVTTASEPGYTMASWSVTSQRTTYGDDGLACRGVGGGNDAAARALVI